MLIEARIVLQYIKRFVQGDGGCYFNTSKPEILLYLQYVFPYCTHKQKEISDTVSILFVCMYVFVYCEFTCGCYYLLTLTNIHNSVQVCWSLSHCIPTTTRANKFTNATLL